MHTKNLRAVLVATALSSALAASAAQASCGDRPGTPNELKAEPVAGAATPTIRFSWRNTTGKGLNKSGSTSSGDTPHRMYFDITVRDGKGNDAGKGLTGTGPFSVTYGSRSHQDFDRLGLPQTLCFWIRARTEGGTQGCISKIASGPVCATTAAVVVPQKPIKTSHGQTTTGGPHIGVVREAGNVFRVIGTKFTRNARVAIRVVDGRTLTGPIITTISGQPISSGAAGIFEVRLHGLCNQAQGPLYFSANDGREDKADKTGTLWSNTVQLPCQR